MAAVVGEALLSAFIEVVLDRLASPHVVDFIRGKKLDVNLVQRLKNTLYAVEAVLNDAELKQIKDSAINNWLDDLKDAVYVADDVLDYVSTKAATAQKKNKEVSTTPNYFSRIFTFEERDMVRKLEEIVATLESILKLKDVLGLHHIATHHSSWRTPSTSLDHPSNIFGRDQDKMILLKLLLDDDNADGRTCVIPIVGMGGVGKTTLAQSLYNHESVKQKFDVQAWVCVSDNFNVLMVTKTIAEEVRIACDTNNLNILQQDLKEKLTGKKFLIVLDDVWTEDYDGWNSLIRPLQSGIKGDEDCWSVFANHACLSSESSEQMDLKEIGREIVTKCKGLPLAAQSLGSLLRHKHDFKDWNDILNCNTWEIDENQSKIIPALRISYHNLPPYLKRCFVYLSLYPKDYEFDKDSLILLWIAEDLLQPPKNGKTLEEVGCQYFNDLTSRSFLQRSGSGSDHKRFVMHDLVHDLATLLGGEFYFRTTEIGKETKIGTKTRHLSFGRFSGPVLENFDIFGRVEHLRTFLTINLGYTPSYCEKVSCFILLNLKKLRVLSFQGFQDLDALPNWIGELIHLRYLDLSFTALKSLPDSLCNLYNLQTLKLRGCRGLTKLPNDMQNLVNLRHLDIFGTELQEMPNEMSKLNNLQHLTYFVVGKHEEKGIKELGTLSNLHGSLSIKKLENVTNSFEATEAKIMDKKYLEEILFVWSQDAKDHFTNSQAEMGILGKLQPTKNLKSLEIDGYRGTKFPEWVGDPSYHNLTKLSLSRCPNCCILPPLGQLSSLKYLTIREMSILESIGFEYDDTFPGTSFPSLECLEFDDMPCWEVWRHPRESHAHFPVLKSLSIMNCPRLKGDLSSHLSALETIRIEKCDQLTSSIPWAPALCSLTVFYGNEVSLHDLPLSLKELILKGRYVTESLFAATAITLPTSLRVINIRDCPSTISFPEDCLPASLFSLTITDCRNLDFPNQNQQHKSLKYLCIINSCDSLTTLSLDALPNLAYFYLIHCENLECLSTSKTLQNLKSINIIDCPKFVSFPRDGLSAPNLTSLHVCGCVNLKSLPCHISTLLPKLQKVSIINCPQIEKFPEGGMPPSLRTLRIINCEKLLRIPSLTLMDMLTSLEIEGPCDGVESFPQKGSAMLPPSLIYLTLRNLSSLHTLECSELLSLIFLEVLTIENCPKLENMAGERFPASLIKLQIYDCHMLKELSKLPYLRHC